MFVIKLLLELSPTWKITFPLQFTLDSELAEVGLPMNRVAKNKQTLLSEGVIAR